MRVCWEEMFRVLGMNSLCVCTNQCGQIHEYRERMKVRRWSMCSWIWLCASPPPPFELTLAAPCWRIRSRKFLISDIRYCDLFCTPNSSDSCKPIIYSILCSFLIFIFLILFLRKLHTLVWTTFLFPYSCLKKTQSRQVSVEVVGPLPPNSKIQKMFCVFRFYFASTTSSFFIIIHMRMQVLCILYGQYDRVSECCWSCGYFVFIRPHTLSWSMTYLPWSSGKELSIS